MLVNVTGFSIAIGLNSALVTLVSQAYGANNLKLCGIYLNRSRFILFGLFVPIGCIIFNSEAILIAIG